METVTPKPYTIDLMAVGILEPQTIYSVYMPREDFLEVFDETLRYFSAEVANDLDNELRPIAETMPRFPMSAWIAPTRGCGCVVGEYLIARAELDRAAFIEDAFGPHPPNNRDIKVMLDDNPLGEHLLGFGNRIDAQLKGHLERYELLWGARTGLGRREGEPFYGQPQSVEFI
jgi:hypothetical protein